MEPTDIEKLIPHRRPFLWIDRILELEPGLRCVAVKMVEADDPVFQGHFPGHPVLPGVLLIEAVAQTAGVMLGAAGAGEPEGIPLLAAVNRFKFLTPVRPPQELSIEVRKLTGIGRMSAVEGIVRVAGEVVATGELSVVSG